MGSTWRESLSFSCLSTWTRSSPEGWVVSNQYGRVGSVGWGGVFSHLQTSLYWSKSTEEVLINSLATSYRSPWSRPLLCFRYIWTQEKRTVFVLCPRFASSSFPVLPSRALSGPPISTCCVIGCLAPLLWPCTTQQEITGDYRGTAALLLDFSSSLW